MFFIVDLDSDHTQTIGQSPWLIVSLIAVALVIGVSGGLNGDDLRSVQYRSAVLHSLRTLLMLCVFWTIFTVFVNSIFLRQDEDAQQSAGGLYAEGLVIWIWRRLTHIYWHS